MNGLMVSKKVTREMLSAVPLPVRTRSYSPVPHTRFIDMVREKVEETGLKVDTSNKEVKNGENLGWARNGDQLFGTLDLLGQDHLNNQVKLVLGFRNSYDKSLSAGVCFGSKVIVCSNLCFTGYADEGLGIVGKISHRHTRFVYRELPGRLQESLGRFEMFRDFQERFFENLTNIDIDDNQAYGTLVRAAQDGALNGHEVLDVASQWKYQEFEPEAIERPVNWHPEFQSRNAWSLFNCITEVHKKGQERNLVKASDRSMQLTKVFQSEFN